MFRFRLTIDDLPQFDDPTPEECGYQADGSYTPSTEEIRAVCERIRSRWTAAEHRRRAAWSFNSAELDLPIVAEPRD